MGIHSNCSNRKNKTTQKSRNKARRSNRQQRKKLQGLVQGEILDADIITEHHLKKRKSDPKCNITLSKKKRRKILKQLEYSKKDKAQMEVEAQTTSKTVKPPAANTDDVEMKE